MSERFTIARYTKEGNHFEILTKPDKALSNINTVMELCLSFVENQALFLNIDITKNYKYKSYETNKY